MIEDDPSGPLLTPDETQALLEAVRGDGKHAPEVVTADLASRDRALKTAWDRAERALVEVPRALRKVGLEQFGSAINAVAEPCEVVTYTSITQGFTPGTAVARFVAATGEPVFLIVGAELAAFAIERRLGAPTDAPRHVPARADLTPMERRILKPFIAYLGETFLAKFATETKCTFDTLFTRPEDNRELRGADPVLRLSLRASVPSVEGSSITLVVPTRFAAATEPPRAPALPVAVPPSERSRWAESVRAASVETAVWLGSAKSTIRELLSLAAGDVLRLDKAPGEPLEMRVGPVDVLRCQPVVHQGNLCVDVCALASPSAERK